MSHETSSQTGESSGDLVAVSGELSVGDQVVVCGAETRSDGAPVQILNREEATANTTAASPTG